MATLVSIELVYLFQLFEENKKKTKNNENRARKKRGLLIIIFPITLIANTKITHFDDFQMLRNSYVFFCHDCCYLYGRQ